MIAHRGVFPSPSPSPSPFPLPCPTPLGFSNNWEIYWSGCLDPVLWGSDKYFDNDNGNGLGLRRTSSFWLRPWAALRSLRLGGSAESTTAFAP